jgi:hypothetical protein
MLRFELIGYLITFGILLGVFLMTQFIWKNAESDARHAFRVGSALFGALFLGLVICSLMPFNPKYWFSNAESGEVTRVESRSHDVVLTLDSGKVVVLRDVWVLNIEVGDDVNLRCRTNWVYDGSDYVTCTL